MTFALNLRATGTDFRINQRVIKVTGVYSQLWHSKNTTKLKREEWPSRLWTKCVTNNNGSSCRSDPLSVMMPRLRSVSFCQYPITNRCSKIYYKTIQMVQMACGPHVFLQVLSIYFVFCPYMIWGVTPRKLWPVLHDDLFKCNGQLYLSCSALNHWSPYTFVPML